MTIARTIGLGLGLIVLVGAGAATLSHGQSSRTGQDKPIAVEDLARLEAEVELLQLEHDVARADLQDFLKKFNRLQLLHGMSSLTSSGLLHQFAKEFSGKDEADANDKALAMVAALSEKEETKQLMSAVTEDMNKLFDSLRAARDRGRKEFVERTKELNEKKRELAKVHQQFEPEAR